MKLEYLERVNPDYPEDSLIRFYNFSSTEALLLRKAIESNLVVGKKKLEIHLLDFIQPMNCELTMVIGPIDFGIRSFPDGVFVCELTEQTYQAMLTMIRPFESGDCQGYQWLYDLSPDKTSIELLLSPHGNW